MPFHEFACAACAHEFEELIRDPGEVVTCPACKGDRVERKLSTFSVGKAPARAQAAPRVGPCGSCGDPRGPGACALDR